MNYIRELAYNFTYRAICVKFIYDNSDVSSCHSAKDGPGMSSQGTKGLSGLADCIISI